MSGDREYNAVTCLGCGCACDDLTVRVRDGLIATVAPPCPLAKQWFGDGTVPHGVLVDGRTVGIEAAIAAAADLLRGSARPLVLIAPDLTTQAQRAAIAVADALRADVDGATSDTAAAGLQAAQRRGRAAATLGELRNRADLVLLWGVDPRSGYPRYMERYAAATSSTHAPSRTLMAVSVGGDLAPQGCDLSAEFSAAEEVDALAVMTARVRGQLLRDLPPRLEVALVLAERLLKGRYVAIVHDAEPGDGKRDGRRAEGLLALAEALNGPTRAALSTLRAGGNRSGAEAALTWQTGYPTRVSFRPGYPRSSPERSGVARLRSGDADAVLIAGSAAALGAGVPGPTPAVVIGPRASESAGARVAIDTGVAGIHDAGTAYRMDDVPLPLSPVLPGPRSAAETLGRAAAACRTAGRAS